MLFQYSKLAKTYENKVGLLVQENGTFVRYCKLDL